MYKIPYLNRRVSEKFVKVMLSLSLLLLGGGAPLLAYANEVDLGAGGSLDEHKVQICHIPQGNPENQQMISVDKFSVTHIAHLEHGDIEGACVPVHVFEPVTIVASKVVCDTEAKLPNWGLGSSNITPTTAIDFVASNEGCALVPDWKFQWGFGNKSGNPGVTNHFAGSFVGEADGSAGVGSNTGTEFDDWKTFGPTNISGVASVSISDLNGASRIWVREVLKDGYVPFAYDDANVSNSNTVSAEIYCSDDVLNYDNYDYINAPGEGQTYHCVAFNVLKETPPPPTVCEVDIVSDTLTTVGGGVNAVATYDQNPRWTASINGATWIWDTPLVTNPSQDQTVEFSRLFSLPSVPVSSQLIVAADNSYTVSLNGLAVGADNTEYNYLESGKDTYSSLSGLTIGTNTLNFLVKNWGLSGSSPQSNPAGLLYKLHIGLAGTDCPPPPHVNKKPVITVTLPNPTTMIQFGLYTDAGATAYDVEDGDLTGAIVATGSVNTSVVGTYTIAYNVSDSEGLAADTKTRTVYVNPAPKCSDTIDNDGDTLVDYPADPGCDSPTDDTENLKPVITLLGDIAMSILLGTSYTEPSATVADPEEGNITSKLLISGTVDAGILGAYVVKYNATDSQNLAADEVERTVTVVAACSDGIDNDGDGNTDFPADTGCTDSNDNNENNTPVITLLGLNPTNVTIGGVFTDSGSTALDAEDGDISTSTIVTGTVNTSVLGIYTLYYNVTDSEGLAATEKTRVVNVNPVVTECNDGIDNDGDLLIDFGSDLGCDSTSDNDENDKPVISIVGADPMTVYLNTTFTDPSATVLDAEDGDITVPKLVSLGTVDISVLGAYTITYNATDSKNLAADTKTRIINVVSTCTDGIDNDSDGLIDYPTDPGCSGPNDDSENSKPIITLLGSIIMNLSVGTAYVEPNATVADAEEGDITSKLVIAGSVNTSLAGTYTVTYNATDSQSLAADQKTRTVNVAPAVCTVNCGGSTTFDYYGCTDPSALNYNSLANKNDGSCKYGGGGGEPVTLTIFNEKVQSTGTTTVVISWNTNLAADSRVAYGLDPVITLGIAPLYGYNLTTATESTLTTSHSVTIEGVPSAVSAYFRPVSTANTQTKVGIELTRGGVLGEATTSCFYLKTYMRLGTNNDPAEVTKLQSFLKDYEGFTSLVVNGFFGQSTDTAVRAFQDKYKSEILTPWGLLENTGYVYYTTQKKINEIYCEREFPMTQDQVVEIAQYNNAVTEYQLASMSEADVSLTSAKSESGIVAGANTVKIPALSAGQSKTSSVGDPIALSIKAVASTESKGILSGVSLADTESLAEVAPSNTPRGQIALADILATSPSVGGIRSGTQTNEIAQVEPVSPVASGEVISSTSSKQGLAAVMGSLTSGMNFPDSVVYLFFALIVLLIGLSVVYYKKYRIQVSETE